MLRWRLLFGISISVCVVGLCLLDVFLENRTGIPGIALFPLMLLLLILACHEMLLLANRNRVYPVPYITYLSCIIVGLSGWGTFAIQHTINQQEDSRAVNQDVLEPDETRPLDVPSVSISENTSEVIPEGSAENSSEAAVASAQSADDASQERAPNPTSSGSSKRDTKAVAALLKQLEHLTPGNWILSAFAFTLILVFLQEMYSFVRPGAVNVRMAYTIFTIVYAGVLMTFLALIRLCFGLVDLIAFIAVVKMGDVGAYTIGRLFGRNKMAPGLSPGKTIEGAIGAILFAGFTAWLCYALILPWVEGKPVPVPFNPLWLVYGTMLGFLGMLGDLAESLMKRDAEVKDASDMVPGFGGVLDLLDSLLLSAPVAYAFLTLGLLSL